MWKIRILQKSIIKFIFIELYSKNCGIMSYNNLNSWAVLEYPGGIYSSCSFVPPLGVASPMPPISLLSPPSWCHRGRTGEGLGVCSHTPWRHEQFFTFALRIYLLPLMWKKENEPAHSSKLFKQGRDSVFGSTLHRGPSTQCHGMGMGGGSTHGACPMSFRRSYTVVSVARAHTPSKVTTRWPWPTCPLWIMTPSCPWPAWGALSQSRAIPQQTWATCWL